MFYRRRRHHQPNFLLPGADGFTISMYQSVRDESISSQQSMQQVINWSITSAGLVFALLAFLIEKVPDCFLVLFWAWIIIWLLGILGISQYAGEAGRMLRASYYGRLLEAYFFYSSSLRFPLSLMWETYLSDGGEQKGWGQRRLSNSYRLSALAALSGLVLVQFAPYLMVSASSRCHDLSPWLVPPCVGSITSFWFLGHQILAYTKKFPPNLCGRKILQAHNIQIQKTGPIDNPYADLPSRF